MTRSDLGQNQIVPAARPVDAFIAPGRIDVAAPAQPQMLPNPSGIRTIGQASGGSMQGANQFEELARALAPFSRDLVQLGGLGLELYASDQYQRGQTEAARALVQANQQMLASGASYANENRKLSQVDPVAALMMDRVNPFRDAGRQNRLSRAAGQAMIPEVLREFDSIPGVAEIREGSPVFKQLTAGVVDKVLRRFGISEASPGFIEHVLPQINQAEQRLYDRHLELRTKQLKEYAWRETAFGMGEIIKNARATGTVEWTEFDPNTGREVRAVANRGQNKAAWDRGVQRLLTRELNRLADETGITGEATELKRRAAVRLAEMARVNNDPELLRLLLQSDFGGAPDKSGRRLTVGEAVGIEILEDTAKIGQTLWQERQRQTEQGIQDYESRLAQLTYGLPDGPEKGQRIDALTREFAAKGVPLGKLMEAAKGMAATIEDVRGRSYNTDGMDALLQDMQGRVGPLWNARQADEQFERTISSVPAQNRPEYRRQYMDIRRAKEREQADAPNHLVRPIIDGAIKSRLREFYPNDITEAALRGSDITALMAYGDADVARSAQLQFQAYQKHVLSRIAEAEAKKKARLDAREIVDVTTRAMEEYGKSDEKNFNRLFPGSDKSNEPSVSGRARPPRAGGPAGGRPGAEQGGAARPAPAVYQSGQLDNMPGRRERLLRGDPVLQLPSLQEELIRVMNRQPPSPAVVRAARDAGFGNNVGRWLLREAEAYPGFTIPLPARQQLLRSSRDAQGMTDSMQTAAATVGRPISYFANTVLNALTGTLPAVARTIPPAIVLPPSRALGNIGAFRAAIIGKESGGNYAAVNPDSGALGIGQVMPANVGPWTQKYLGRRLTPAQFLADRNAQDAVVNGRFRDMLADQQAAGFRGEEAIRRAAAVWYSGQARLWNDTRPQFTKGRRYPSIAEYTQAIWESYKRNGGEVGRRSAAEPDSDLANQLVAQLSNEQGYEDVASLNLRGIVKRVESFVQPATKAVYQQFDKLFNSGKAIPQSPGKPAPRDVNARIAAAAEAFRDQSTAAGPGGGQNACAWAINKVLKNAGVKVPWVEAGRESVYIPFIEDSIRKGAGKQVAMEQAKPGDIISFDGGHMAIVTKVSGGSITWLSNSSSSASFSYGGSFEPPKPRRSNTALAQVEAEIQADIRKSTRVYRLNPQGGR